MQMSCSLSSSLFIKAVDDAKQALATGRYLKNYQKHFEIEMLFQWRLLTMEERYNMPQRIKSEKMLFQWRLTMEPEG